LAAFKKAAELDAALPQAELGMALAWEGLSRPADAVPPLEKYLAAQPLDLETRFHLARTYLQLGKNEEALQNLDTVFLARPDLPAGLCLVLATCYDDLRIRPQALEAYERFLALSHDQSPDQEWQARQRAKLLRRELRK